jgi:K+-transporting ATPase ATPase A chain
MTLNGLLQIGLYFAVLIALVRPLGAYMARVYAGKPIMLNRVLGPVERAFYRLLGTSPGEEMDWKTYTLALLLFSVAGFAMLYGLLRLQGILPLNPNHVGAVPSVLAFNTAISFVTNTNWQNYGGETTMSHLTQMLGLTVQNFASAASGMAVAMALIRGFARHSAQTIGNFWVDLTRGILYVLLPLACILAFVLVSQGVVQTLAGRVTVALQQPLAYETQSGDGTTTSVVAMNQEVALGPVASQVAIKHLGTNGGGFFSTNSAHPFENPTPLTDLLATLAETMIPAALTYTFGRMVGDQRQGWALLAAMLIVLAMAVGGAYAAEAAGNPRVAALGIDQTASNSQPGGNMEGKELRFGIPRSSLFAVLTTATSCGAVNAMHDSFTPLGGLVPLAMMQFSEVILGGVGSGLYGMLVFAIIAVFIAGLMVGRTSEYLGKKIGAYEMKMASLVILVMPIVVLGLTAIGAATNSGTASIANPGAHGFSEILYAFTSQGNNNGSAFAGLAGNTPFYNVVGALAMLLGRFWLAIPTLALAGSLAHKKMVPVSMGTLPTHTGLFVVWLIAVVIIIGALVFFPALALGPIAEHLLMIQGYGIGE